MIPLPTFGDPSPDRYQTIDGRDRSNPCRGFVLAEDGHKRTVDPVTVAFRVHVRIPAFDGQTTFVSKPLYEWDARDTIDWIEARLHGTAEIEVRPVKGWVSDPRPDPMPATPRKRQPSWSPEMHAAFYAVMNFANQCKLGADFDKISAAQTRMNEALQEVPCTEYVWLGMGLRSRSLPVTPCKSPVHDERLHGGIHDVIY